MLRDNDTQSLFDGYYFERRDELSKKSTSYTTAYTE